MHRLCAFVRALLVASALVSAAAHAQLDAEPLPGDPKLVVFSYDANNSYRVFTRPLASTHIELAADERIKVLALGDTAGWITAARENNIFIKPRFPNSSTSGTLITTRRTYQFLFRSTQENGRWYQRVSFQNPEDLAIDAADADRQRLTATGTDQARPTAGADREPPAAARLALATSPEQLNFNYEISGNAEFKPLNVFDDGVSTFIQIRPGSQDIPAVFRLLGGDKDIELVEYVLKGNSLVVPRVMDAGLLKLGREEVRFYNKTRVTRKFFGGYSFGEGAGQ